jgi:hypothetical protein
MEECNELFEIRYLILGVIVQLQLLVIAIKNVTQALLVTKKITSYVTL